MINLFFKSFGEGFTSFGKKVAGAINFILLSLAYFLGGGLSFLILKISKKRLMVEESFEGSYWKELNLRTPTLSSCYRQF
ncbi:hypothetical protein HN865_02415 [Candidatus Woesearchaeota archaeon]|jgi:hypothetical protein|nr:hypothetical protein [Candidatus Woesearchaeota archaeon]